MCMWPCVVNSLPNGVVHVLAPRGRRHPLAPSKSSREFKHKPICERIFCSSIIHFSLGIPSQMSGVLLASKLAYVLISPTGRLSTIQGVWWFCFHFSCGRSGVSCVIPVSHVLTWGGGRGTRGTIAIFKDALENSREHFTMTSAITCCWPLDTFKRKRL
uniref:Uncharacterized protein n=1 Tax=Molossus molossus TaxID=27622 RepID=A0A7J8JW80_MOLMO|nr:hypothetical protein HJG59_008087 [Molossus molossus]